MIPSLNINITEKCNFKCCYCPEYGESIIHEECLCDIDSIILLINIAKMHGINVLRLTGGEPLLEIERVCKIINTAIDANYSKIVLNTNGALLSVKYSELIPFKNRIIIKVSLDTLNPKTFENITSVNDLNTVLAGISTCIDNEFLVSINLVYTTLNINEFESVIKYANDNKLEIKILGLSSFGGHVDIDKLFVPLNKVYEFVSTKYTKLKPEYLPGNAGKPMETYLMDCGKRIFIVDHENIDNNQYVLDCLDCEYYPCSFGRLHITLTAGGSIRGCRLKNNSAMCISKKNENVINSYFKKVLKEFDKPIGGLK